ncbi:alpha/beta hydrolase-fold protein [Streptomyces sp. NPDC005808]|uniref:alpha/beta hydrolase-fold protein n=1 Tax=Streptomyces sp. NPDC005808 TaxID=3364734 RepID=UPI0036B5C89B
MSAPLARVAGPDAAPPDPRTGARPVRITGPRVARLVRDLAATDDDRRAVLTEQFWADVERLGTPLVEELADEPGHRAVTFVWRGDGATRQVLLLGNRIIDRENLAGSLLEHIPGTDVWYLGLRLRADHAGSYRMAADISAEEPPKDPDELQQRLRSLSGHAAPDPLNRHAMPTRWHPADSSVFALPDSPAQPWAGRHGTVPAGRVERHRVTATALGGDRDVWVYLPPDREQSAPENPDGPDGPGGPGGPGRAVGSGGADPLPVLVLCDGDMWFGRLGLGQTLDALIADGALPPLAVLSPDAVDRHTRWNELGGREEFVSFLTDELLPWAAGRWPLTADPGRTVVAGQSLGALTALYAAHLRPDRFGKVLAQSASLWWRPGLPPGVPKTAVAGIPWVIDLYTEAGPRPLTIHLDVGLHEGLMVDHSRVVYDALTSAGYRMTFNEYNGGHDYACWHSALADGLVRLLGRGPG